MDIRQFVSWERTAFPVAPIAGVVLALTISSVLLTPVVTTPAVAVVLGIPLFLFLPGYTLVTALFPDTGFFGHLVEPSDDRSDATIVAVEAATLSVAGSVSVVMLVGFGLNFSPWGLSRSVVVSSVCLITVLLGVVAAYRRTQLTTSSQLQRQSDDPPRPAASGVTSGYGRRDVLVGCVAAGGLVSGVGTGLYTLVDPPRDATYTQFFLLTETQDGDLVADDYPTDFVAGQPQSLVVGITNNERTTTSYEVVVTEQRLSRQGEDTRVAQQAELGRYATTVQQGETDHRRIGVEPTMTGSQQRLRFSLYRDHAPETPSQTTAYRTVHLWVSVSDAQREP